MEKLELSARLNKERLMIALAVGGLVLLLLLLITYLYIRTLSMNRKLEAARRAVEKNEPGQKFLYTAYHP